jgi:hypothetical protein
MLTTLKIATIMAAALLMVTALAHALELPGKMRLSKDAYFAVQRIYYPGFTIAGISEPVSLLLILVLLFFVRQETLPFWLTLVALLALVGVSAIYWIFIHPTNKVWVRGEALGSMGAGFFSLGRSPKQDGAQRSDWTGLRNRWEYAHAVRAGFATVGFALLVIAHCR